MKKYIFLFLIGGLLALSGCTQKNQSSEAPIEPAKEETAENTSDADVADALENLYSIQLNYSQGTAPLMEIPAAFAETLYDNYDKIIESGADNAPIMLREYAATNEVFFDYDTDYSIKWEKDTGLVSVEETDVKEREEFKQKAHK